MVHSLPGFSDAEIMRYAYAIEYDCADPLQLFPYPLPSSSMTACTAPDSSTAPPATRKAAAQGLVAGINAALSVLGKPP